jgi:hypothetical protein
VAHRKASFGDPLAVIAQAALVMEDGARDRVFRRVLAT